MMNEFISHFENVKKVGKNQYTARCPVHGDLHNSLSIGYSDEKSHILVYCHAGCEIDEILKSIGLKMSDLYPEASKGKQILYQKTYIYKDENNEDVYYKTRIDYGVKDKTFFFEQPNGKKNLKGAHRVPYNLSEVLKSSTVYFVEGEKCADILIENGLTATTLDTGASSAWQDYYSDYFKDKEVIIIPDNDEAGLKYAEKILKYISFAKVVILPELQEKEDIYDWLKSGHNINELGGLTQLKKTEFISKYSIEKTDKNIKKDNDKEKQDVTMLRLVDEKNAIFFHDTENLSYVAITIDGHQEVMRLGSENFCTWLNGLFYKEKNNAPRKESITQVVSVLKSRALFDNEETVKLSNRVAKTENIFWYNLGNKNWQAVKITTDGWEIVDNPPILFNRYKHQIAQVTPKCNGDIHKIFNYLNIKESHTLFLCWLVSCFVPDIPHAMPIFYGEKGAAKSTACALMKKLIDPSVFETLTMPKNLKSMTVNLKQHWFLPFDNVSHISEEISDTLCRAITGGGIQQRKLYTDADDYIFTFKRCIALNGINNVATRPDLLDRAILIELSRIDESNRRELSELQKNFKEDLPSILGAIFDVLSKAMKIYPDVKLDKLPRMADFARWGYAIGEALGNLGQVFLDEYKANYDRQNIEALNSDVVAVLMIDFMKNRESWTGRVSDLWNQFSSLAPTLGINTKIKAFPSQPNTLSRRLNGLRSNLQMVGIVFKTDPKSDATYITIKNEKISQLPPYQIPFRDNVCSDNGDNMGILSDTEDDTVIF